MAYASGRTYHDADAHIMELPDFLRDHADPAMRERMPRLGISAIGEQAGSDIDWQAKTCPLHNDPAYRDDETQLLLRKNYYAVGSFERAHRPQALDQLGFASQLMFSTWSAAPMLAAEHSGDVALAYAMADAHNRGMAEFCSVDPRLLAVGYVALMDFEQAAAQAGRAIEMGCKALMVASACPANHSPSHIALDRVWAQAQEAQVPIVMHVGGTGQLLSPKYFVNGLPPVLDFHGGAENFRSIDYMAIPVQPAQTMATLILDGVLERFPELRFGIVELGASWVPGWMRYLDSAYGSFFKNEERLQKLSMKPSDYVRRQVRVTPYPGEDTGWIIRQSDPRICMFSSDYPHVEGGRHPLKRFAATTGDCTEEELDHFYELNMADLMGPHLPATTAAAA